MVKAAQGLIKGGPGEFKVIGVDYGGPHTPGYDVRVKSAKAGNERFEALVADIIARGIQSPIKVQKVDLDEELDDGTKLEGEHYVVRFGRNRELAARVAKERLEEAGDPRAEAIVVPATIVPKGMSPREVAEIGISENANRKNPDALETADKAAEHIAAYGDDPEVRAGLCVALGIKPNKLAKLLKLREAEPAVIKAIKDGELSVGMAIKIAALPASKQATVVEVARGKAASKAVKETKKKAKKAAEKPQRRAKAAQADEEVDEVATLPAKAPKAPKATWREVAAAAGEVTGKSTIVRPRTVEVRQVLEYIRENPGIDDGVTGDDWLSWVVGDVACPVTIPEGE